MNHKKLDQLIDQMENYIECWKQFNHFVAVGRNKKFSEEDDIHFLEVKSVLVRIEGASINYPGRFLIIGDPMSGEILADVSALLSKLNGAADV